MIFRDSLFAVIVSIVPHLKVFFSLSISSVHVIPQQLPHSHLLVVRVHNLNYPLEDNQSTLK